MWIRSSLTPGLAACLTTGATATTNHSLQGAQTVVLRRAATPTYRSFDYGGSVVPPVQSQRESQRAIGRLPVDPEFIAAPGRPVAMSPT